MYGYYESVVKIILYRNLENILLYIYALSIMCERIAVTYFVPVSNYIALPLIVLIIIRLFFERKIKNPKLVIFIFLLWGWMTIGMIWSTNINALILRYSLVTLLLLVTFCITQRGLTDTELYKLEIVCFIGGLATAVTLLVSGENFYGNMLEERLSLGERNDPNFYAMTLLYAWAIGYQYIYSKHKMVEFLGVVGVIIILYAIIMLGSRGALLACVVTVIAYELYRRHFKVLLLLSIAVVGLMTWLAGMFDRFTLDMMLESGGAGRTDIWMVGIEMIKDNFFQGVGLHNFESRYNEYAALSETGYSRGLYRAPHNFILEIWAELGLIGLILYGYIIYYASKCINKKLLQTHISLLIGLVSTFIAAFFLTSIAEKIPWLLLAVLGAYECHENGCRL